MNEFLLGSQYFGAALTIGAFMAGRVLQKKTGFVLFNPILVGVAICIAVLKIFDIDYEAYNHGAQFVSYFLNIATISLAILLYEQLTVLKKNFLAIIIGISSGVLASAVSVLALSIMFGFTHQEFVTMLPHSITTAMGMALSEEYEGYVSVGPFAQQVSVEIDFAAVVHAFEIDVVACGATVHAEVLPVPTYASGQVSCATGQRGRQLSFYGPVVRKVQLPPLAIVIVAVYCGRVIGQPEEPALVEFLRLSERGLCMGGLKAAYGQQNEGQCLGDASHMRHCLLVSDAKIPKTLHFRNTFACVCGTYVR